MSKFTHCVVFFPETKYYSVLDRKHITGKIVVGKTLELNFPIRSQPFEAEVKVLCHSKEEAEARALKLVDGGGQGNGEDLINGEEERSCSWSPEPHKTAVDSPDHKSSHNNYVTSDLFCDVMNRVVEVLKDMQASSSIRLEACIKEMSKFNEKQDSGSQAKVSDDNSDEKEPEQPEKIVEKVIPAPVKPTPAKPQHPAAKWPPTSGTANNNAFEDDLSGPTWEFVPKEKVDEIHEDCDNYKIFARKISYAIFDEHEQKLKMNERNKKKVSELRKVIRLKYPSERREFDDMIWRTCKNAVNNTTYNEAKRRKRHPALIGSELTGQNFLSSTYDTSDFHVTPSKRLFDPGNDQLPKHEPSEMNEF